ncbi:MAG: helix-turn-helix domain-containing protein [Candidatus Aenigmarchaeota archaeon]|nr:helix-turn-helix domain-containing protein [Candidatus Aenigmarchaeota archaeon]
MVRKINENKIQTILNCLKKHTEGTYVSEISRETGLSKSTVSYLLAKHLSDKTKEIKSGKGGLFKIFILK